MQQATLDQHFPRFDGKDVSVDLKEARSALTFTPQVLPNVPPSYFVSVGYDGDRRACFLRLYEPSSHKIYFWYDTTSHKPYCLSDQDVGALQANANVTGNPGFDHFERVEKYDALRGKKITVTKIVAKDPLTIGGKPTGSIRDSIKAWEADIRYVENYIYDTGLEPGMMYEVRSGLLTQCRTKISDETQREISKIVASESEEFAALAGEWVRLLECPVPSYRRAAIDIEVHQAIATRMPDPHEADQRVIAASVAASDGAKRVLLLRRPDVDNGAQLLPPDVRVEFYNDELGLICELFRVLLDYPVVLTFNGDDFDMRYLWNRAQKLGLTREEIPIEMGRDSAFLRYGVHVDLYRFFFNRSIQIYAFGQKYRENTLAEVAGALLGNGKLDFEKSVSDLTYSELAAYCYRDSEIALALTTFNDDLVMKLMTAISRISYMTIDDVSRQGVSGWIRSIMFCHHRKRGYLIPRSEELEEVKGGTTTEAVIKGKKYKGAIVVEPRPGVHFNVAVLDFASLYPSIMKIWNLGYETVRCNHTDAECKENLVPGTLHWVCKKRRALESLLIGSLRDIRVDWYKTRSKDPTLTKAQNSWYKVVSDALKVVLNACFTADTEVLTPGGKRKLTDLKVGDEVYTLNQRTGRVEVKPIVECQHFVYNGPMVNIQNRFVDWKVTANHNLYLGKRVWAPRHSRITFTKREALLEASHRGRRYLFRHSARDAATDGAPPEKVSLWSYVPSSGKVICLRPNRKWERKFSNSSRFDHYSFTPSLEHIRVSRYYLTTRTLVESVARTPQDFERLYNCRILVRNFESHGSQSPWRFEPRALFELIGWYASEGSIQIGHNKRGFKLARVTITQYKKHRSNRKRIVSLVKELGLRPRVGERAVSFSSRIIAEFLRNECGAQSQQKCLPSFVFGAPFELRKILFDSLMSGDGNIPRQVYSTVSPKLADDFQNLAFSLGIESMVTAEMLRSGNKIYRIKLYRRSHHVLREDNFRITPTKQLDVYCVTAQDNHIIYAGRKGKLGWIGQSYGVFGAGRFALYCPPVAEATAAIGRHTITSTIEKAEALGVEVFYGDTDSIFLSSQSGDLLNKLVEWSRRTLQMEMEIDKNYRYLALSSRKKNYLGVYPDGSVDIKGLTGKKRHIPIFLHDAFYEMVKTLSQVKSQEEFEAARTKITETVKTCYQRLRSRDYSLEDLAFQVMMSRTPDRYTKTTPQHVKAALQLAEGGVEVKAGDLIGFVKVVGEKGVKPVKLASKDEVDVPKYMEYLRSTFEQVLDSIGVEFEELIGIKKLESFFPGTA